MGARWAWWARCPSGHVYSNFSGGADDCYECDKEPVKVIDCHHWVNNYEGCDCREQIKQPPPGARQARSRQNGLNLCYEERLRKVEAQRDLLLKKCQNVAAWLDRLSAHAAELATDTRFPALAAANKADALNYKATADDIRAAIAKAESR